MMDTNWMTEALCGPQYGHDPETWFPNLVGQAQRQQIVRAQSICHGCDVIVECRNYARGNNFGFGIWGAEHRSHAVREAAMDEFHAGSEANAAAHRRRGERPCGACRRAETRAKDERQRKRRA